MNVYCILGGDSWLHVVCVRAVGSCLFRSNLNRMAEEWSLSSSSVSPLDHWKLINVDLVFNGSAPILFVAQKYYLHCVRTYHLQRSSHFAKCFDNNPIVISLKFNPILARACTYTANACGHFKPDNMKSICVCAKGRNIVDEDKMTVQAIEFHLSAVIGLHFAAEEWHRPTNCAPHKNRFQIIDVNSFCSVFDATHQS